MEVPHIYNSIQAEVIMEEPLISRFHPNSMVYEDFLLPEWRSVIRWIIMK